MILELAEKIEKIAVPLISEMNLVLVDLKICRRGKALNIEVLVDRPCGGITIEECSKLNKEISQILETEDFIRQQYVLEVSSPGVDRPLRTRSDFRRVVGQEIIVFLSEPVESKLEHSGLLADVTEDDIVLKRDEQDIAIAITKVNKGKQII